MSTDFEYNSQLEELNRSLELLNEAIENDTTKSRSIRSTENFKGTYRA